MLKNLKISVRLLVGFGIVTVMLIVSAVVASINLSQSNKDIDRITNVYMRNMALSWNITADLWKIEEKLSVALLYTDDVNTEKYISDGDAAVDELRKVLAALQQSYLGDPKDLTDILALLDECAPFRKQIGALAKNNLPADNEKAFTILTESYMPLFEKVIAKVSTAQEGINLRATEVSNAAIRDSGAATIAVIALGVLSVMFAIAISLYITSTIRKPLVIIDAVAQRLAEGDFSVRSKYQAKDEIGDLSISMNDMAERLGIIVSDVNRNLGEIAEGNFDVVLTADFVGDFIPMHDAMVTITASLSQTIFDINEASKQVSSGANQVSNSAQALAQGATEQASSVEELSASIANVSEEVKQAASSAKKAAEISNSSANLLKAGNDEMGKLVLAMDDISVKSSEIKKINKTIEDIAFQTNILALNAAVEAARAGAAGKGFAVVADEVRNLAGKSAEAAKTTTMLIESSVLAVENGMRIAGDTAKALVEVMNGARKSVEIIETIAIAASDQALAISQINQGVEQISSVVQTNSATSQESAAASEELSGQANVVKELLSKFKLQKNMISLGGTADTMDFLAPAMGQPFHSSGSKY